MRSLFLILIFAVLGWSACYNYSGGGNWENQNCVNVSKCYSSPQIYSFTSRCCSSTSPSGGVPSGKCHISSVTGAYPCTINYVYCDSETEADSLNCLHSGNQWIDGSCCDAQCVCEKDGGQWVAGACQNCNEHTNEHTECTETWNTGYMTDADGNPGGGGYWQITLFDCYVDSCSMSTNCTEKSSFPAGTLTCDDFQDTIPGNPCMAVGFRCTIQCPNNKTISCDCDGDCKHAQTRRDCQCPQEQSSSSQAGSSSSENNSSSSGQNSSSSSAVSSSSEQGPNSSDSPKDSTNSGDWEYNYSGVLNDIEYNTRRTANNTANIANSTNEIAVNTNIAAGYLSSIDRWQIQHNLTLQAIKSSTDEAASEAAQAAEATQEVRDTLHNTNGILSGISGYLGDTSAQGFDGVGGWVDSSRSSLDSIRARIERGPDSVAVDSMKPDTSYFKSTYSSLFLSNTQTRNGCYEFKLKKPIGNSKFAQKMQDIEVDFANLGGVFDMCSIGRGVVRVCGAILCIITMIVSYKAAFKGGE